MDVADALRDHPSKIAIVAAAEDTIVPPRRTAALRGASGDIALDHVIAGVGHNDIYDSEVSTGAMRKALLLIAEQVRYGK